MIRFQGIPVSEGYAKAGVFCLRQTTEVQAEKISDCAAEQERLRKAIEEAKKQLSTLIEKSGEALGDNAEVFEAHLMMLEDDDFTGDMADEVAAQSICAPAACAAVSVRYQEMFRAMDSEYMQARAADVADISQRIIDILTGSGNQLASIREPSILVADDLTPSQTAGLTELPVHGFLTRQGGKTSHSAIMARTLGIPAVASAGDAVLQLQNGTMLLLDGCTGEIIADPDKETEDAFDQRCAAWETQQRLLAQYLECEGSTSDGHRVIIEGNIGTPQDADGVLKNGGEGVGLFRSEFLFMDRNDLPGETEQFMAYREAAEKLAGKPVIIRTLDIGGDKEVPALALEREQNPFLGYRAIRICLQQQDLFLTQLRALLRASAYGDVRIMFPMIASLEEVRAAKAVLERAKQQLRDEQVPFREDIKTGIMIEVPAAAVCADILAKEVDFFSIGTNDLIQYTCAVDRINDKLAALYRPLHPGVLRLIRHVCVSAREAGIEVGVCGEMAGSRGMASVLCGLGVTNLSMSASSILAAKSDLAHHTYEECVALANMLLQASNATENEEMLNNH